MDLLNEFGQIVKEPTYVFSITIGFPKLDFKGSVQHS